MPDEKLPMVEPREGLYRIFTTSDRFPYGDGLPPAAGAFRARYYSVDRRYVDDPGKLANQEDACGKWFEWGENHRVVGGNICRDFVSAGWFIEVADLASLLAIAKEADCPVILSPSMQEGDFSEIEIYDDYRE